MGKNLVLVESPAKAKTINKYLGRNYVVEATIGHLRNLPKTKLGVNIDNNFEPEFVNIRGKGDIIKRIKSLSSKSENVYIATDPDREGEAIAQDIAEIITAPPNGKLLRVLFNEITKNGVLRGMQNPRTIDSSLVQSQRARRVMDRIIGYKMSPFLWKAIITASSNNLSAGRVQSVALRLICEREEAILNFNETEYWSILGSFSTKAKDGFVAKLFSIEGKEIKYPPRPGMTESELETFFAKHVWIQNQAQAEDISKSILGINSFVISKINKRASRRNPSPPFITSSLQAEASRVLRLRAKQTMSIAQKLYEGLEIGSEGLVGLITYMRTDSTRVSEEIVQEARNYIGEAFGKEYMPQTPNNYEKKKSTGVQDAHEAIRPTSMRYTPEFVRPYLDDPSFNLYSLIWKRFVASQMAPAQLETTIVDISCGNYLFKAYGQTILFDGFMRTYYETQENPALREMDADEAKNEKIPRGLSENDVLDLLDLQKRQHFTKALPRYTESSLIKELESKGIGRPSTYSMIVSTVLDRGYVTAAERKLTPTELGKRVNRVLVLNFPDIINVDFTAGMENELDQIAQGENQYLNVLNDFYHPFASSLAHVEQSIEKILCDKCGGEMAMRYGRFGRFLACSNYPECKNIKSLKELADEQKPIELTGEKCEKCGANTVFRTGKYGKFIGCERYPDCDYVKNITLGIACPKCKEGEITEKTTRTRKVFYGCTRYPGCDFSSWQRPSQTSCPNGDSPYMEERYTKKKGKYLRCPVCAEEILEENNIESED